MKRYARLLLAIAFVAMLAAPALIRRFSHRAAAPVAAAGDADLRYGFRLEEASKKSGIDFVHEAPTLDRKLTHIMPQVASMGAAVAVADVDADGFPDLYVTSSKEGSKNRLYRNRGDGTFEDVAERFGVADVNRRETGVSMGAVFGDYDNDGFEDLFLYKWGRPELFHNDGGRGFSRATEQASLPSWANINTAVWLDYDRDGRLDLFLGGYYPERLNLWDLADTKIMPESFEYANNGGRKYLYRNAGGGRFEEASARAGLSSTRWALAAVAADLRGTGYPDLFIANDYGVSELFINEGGRFREAGRETGVGYAPKSGMNASVGDVLNQGRLAIYVSNISEEGILLQGNNLWVPTAARAGLPKYENMARAMGIDLGGWSFGAQFGDLEQRRLPRSLSRQRLRVGLPRRKLLVRLLEGRGRAPDRHRRRRELAGHGRAQPRRIPAEESLDQRRIRRVRGRRADGRRDRSLRRPVGRARRLRRPRGARCRRRQPARTAAACTGTTSRRTGSGSRSISKAAAGATPRRNRAATGARSARRSKSRGAGGRRCRRSRAAPASARRTSAGSTSDSVSTRRSIASSCGGLPARLRS